MSAAVSVWWLAARWPSAIATFHLLADNSRAMYSISLTLVSLIRACFVVPISILLGGLVGMYFLPQEARLGEPFIASPPLRKGGKQALYDSGDCCRLHQSSDWCGLHHP